uniref:MPN domain-containing protein n=1 Tax=Brassica campestris TaxID=3711 RepID=A0A3P5Z9S4_BRACM|nr:unnamed protein product [Brassica rapa]
MAGCMSRTHAGRHHSSQMSGWNSCKVPHILTHVDHHASVACVATSRAWPLHLVLLCVSLHGLLPCTATPRASIDTQLSGQLTPRSEPMQRATSSLSVDLHDFGPSVHQEFAQICPSKVADPRPEPALPSLEEKEGSSAYQHLHVPVRIMEDFLRLARSNTKRNLETCGVLAGSLKNRVFYITTLIIPKQESTSDSPFHIPTIFIFFNVHCQTLNEEEIFEVQDILSLFPLGWIHTHPTETCFMSSVDLHTHYSYQIMLPEAVAIVMARTDETTPHGIFHLSDPSGVFVIRNCQQRGFHPHEKSEDSNPIYEHCSHVFLNAKLKYEVLELR